MSKVELLKNPVLRSEVEAECFSPVGDALEEINNISAAGFGAWLKSTTVISDSFGNKGAVCTGTIECQNNCR